MMGNNNLELEADIEDNWPMNQIVFHCYSKVLEFFRGDKDKADVWFSTKNPNLGKLTPNEMIMIGKTEKLKSFIDNALEGNFP